jgi:hypothetical protein
MMKGAHVNGETEWKDSCGDSTMEEMAAYIQGNQGVLAGRLAGHETLL